MPKHLPLTLLVFTSCLGWAQTSVEVLYVSQAQTKGFSLRTFNINPATAAATQVGQAIKSPAKSVDPVTVGTNHVLYVWNSNDVWVYPTNGNGVPASSPSQHLTFGFNRPVYKFIADPDGKFAYAALVWIDSSGNNHAEIILFTIAQSTGKLTNTRQVVANYGPDPYTGFTDFLFGASGKRLYARFADNAPYTYMIGYDYYSVNQTTGQLGKLQTLSYGETSNCTTSCGVAITDTLSATDGVCCGPGSGALGIYRTFTGKSIYCTSSNYAFCADDVATLNLDPASQNVFSGDATVNDTYIGHLDFTSSQLVKSPSSIPGTPPLFFSPDSHLVYALNATNICIYALQSSTGILKASTTIPVSSSITIATATLR